MDAAAVESISLAVADGFDPDIHMAFHVTQCPGCDSTFNTNARILLSAAGKVRCGACLTVFEAMENLIATAEPEEDDDTSVFVGNNPNDYFDPTLFITRSALSAFAATADQQATFTTAPDLIETTAADVTTLNEIQELAIPDEQATVPELTTPAAIVATVVAEPATADTPSPASAPLAAIEQDYDLIDIDTFEFVEVQLGDGVDAEHAEEFTEQSAQEFVAEHKTDPAEERVTAAVTVTDDNSAIIPPPPVIENDDSTAAIRARAFRATLRDDNALEALPQSTRAAIGRVLPPVELLSGSERRWGRRLLLASAGLLLSALLLAQFLWQRLPIYSRSPQWRPIYEFACGYIACTLPVYNEISAIRSDNLVVRSHPANADALSVSLSFRNTAQFPQPFPILILSFNSATNAIIALREFAPAEYLDAGLQQMELMPVLAPVQIELEVMDPGADAVNYTVAFRRP